MVFTHNLRYLWRLGVTAIISVFLFCSSSMLQGASGADETPLIELSFEPSIVGPIETKERPSAFTLQPDQQLLLLQVKLPSGWKFYGQEPGDFGFAPRLDWSQSINIKQASVQWPTPRSFKANGYTSYGYEGKISLPITLTLKDPKEPFKANLKIEYLACGPNICAPQTNLLTYDSDSYSSKKEGSGDVLMWMLILAFTGGTLLNLMPCVLPVLAIKAFQVLEGSQKDQTTVRYEAQASGLGIIVSFLILASILIGLKHLGIAIGWGMQFQHPSFLAFLSLVLILFSGNLFGLFEFRLPYWLSVSTRSSGFMGSFLTGCLIMLLATPCTAPLIGTAAGFAFHQPAPIILLIFLAIGAGLATPYWVLSVYPNALPAILPKAGPWMVTFKKALGGMVFLTALWVVFLLYYETTIFTAISVLLFGMAFVYAASDSLPSNWMSKGSLSILAILAAMMILQDPPSSPSSTNFRASLPEEQARTGKSSFVVVTAEWCLTCKVNERAVLNTPTIQNALKAAGVHIVTADWTTSNPEISKYMGKFGSSGVPFYSLHTAKCPTGEALPTLLSSKDVLDALAKCQ